MAGKMRGTVVRLIEAVRVRSAEEIARQWVLLMLSAKGLESGWLA